MSDRQPDGMVRPFIMTGGRTRTTRSDLRWETLIEALPDRRTQQVEVDVDRRITGLSREQIDILARCHDPVSIAELSAHLHLPLVVVTILAGDLLDAHLVYVHATDPVEIEISALNRM